MYTGSCSAIDHCSIVCVILVL